MGRICRSAVTVTGEPPQVDRFMAAVESHMGAPLSFHTLLPEPTGAGCDDLHRWRQRAWGADSDAFDVKATASAGEVSYRFATHGHAPTKWVRRASALYPQLRFTIAWVAPSNPHAGVIIARATRMLHAEFARREAQEGRRAWQSRARAPCPAWCEAPGAGRGQCRGAGAGSAPVVTKGAPRAA